MTPVAGAAIIATANLSRKEQREPQDVAGARGEPDAEDPENITRLGPAVDQFPTLHGPGQGHRLAARPLPEEAAPWMKMLLSRLDDKVIADGVQTTCLGIPRDGRITERAVARTEDSLIKIGALGARIPYDKLVSRDVLPR